MTKAQQIILVFMILALFGVIALLVVTLLNLQETKEQAPMLTVALLPSATDTHIPDTPTPFSVPPTWTPSPSPPPSDTPTPLPTRTPTSLPTASPTFPPTWTPQPTQVVTPSLPGPTTTASLQNPGFEGIKFEEIPGWEWWGQDNFEPGGAYNPDTSYETPFIKQADDPRRLISGPTLQIDAEEHLKFYAHVFQTVTISPTTRVGFQISAGAYADAGVIKMAAGIDPNGGPDCVNAQWSDIVFQNQEQAVQRITSPIITVGPKGQVTVCLYAEPLYAGVSNAAFFDDAELLINP